MPTTLHENRPSAGIGVVEVQKPMVFVRFLKFPRDPLRGSAWSRCKNSWFLAMFYLLARPSAGIGVVEVQKPMGVVEVQKLEVFCAVLTCSRDPLRGSAGSRCKNSRFFAISAVLAQPSAGIGVVEAQKLEVFATFVVRTGLRELSRGSRACSRNRRVAGSIPPWSAGGRREMQLAF